MWGVLKKKDENRKFPGAVYKYKNLTNYNKETIEDDFVKAETKFGSVEDVIRARAKFLKSAKKDEDKSEILKELLPQDLLKFGMIPEFIGRLPIIATLKELDRKALIKITTEPKNALVKQYKKLFKFDNVELEFEPEALNLIVDKAIERKTGARGLRGILEEILKDSMYSIPSEEGVAKCIVEEGGKVHIVKKQVEDIAC